MDWISLNKVNNDWISIIIFSNLILLSITKWRYDRKLTSFFKSIDPSVYFNNYGNNFFFNRLFGINILIFSLINISLYIIFILNSFGLVKLYLNQFIVLFSFLMSVGFLSYLTNSLFGGMLSIKRETLAYSFNNFRLLFRVSIFIFIILFIHHFYFFNTFIFIRITVFCVLFFYYIKSFIIIYEFLRNINRGGFYFILYLCTLKTTPWVFIFWFINSN
jgi:hypothetical protein